MENLEGMTMTRKEFEEEMLSNPDTFKKYVNLLMDDPGEAELFQGLLDFAWNRYQAENQPANKSWEQEARSKEYNFKESYHEHLRRRGM